MNKDLYGNIKRLMAVVVAVLLWGMSMKFSVDGFGIGDPQDRWMGWVLAFAVTMIELIWNGMKMKSNLTLIVLGICAYLYGIVTNVLGIYAWRGGDVSGSDIQIVALIFSIILGLLLEIAPEPLLVWGILNVSDEGDFLGNLLQNGSGGSQEARRDVSAPYKPYIPTVRPPASAKPYKRNQFPPRY
jgi:hypothetical protein